MLTTRDTEHGSSCHCDEILDQDTATANSDGAAAQHDDEQDLVLVDEEDDDDNEEEDDEGSSDDEEFENEEDNDGEDELDDEDDGVIVPPKSSVIVKAKSANSSTSNGSVAARTGASSTSGSSKMSASTSAMLNSQHRKHHHRRLASRPAITVGVKAGSSRGLAGTKCSALRSRKTTSSSGACHSPVCAGSTSEEEEDDDVVDQSLDREESDDDDDDDELPPDFLMSGLSPDDPSSIQGIPPDAQARLEAFFEAAGFTDGRLMSDPESLRKLTMTVSSALGEASAAINRMRDSQRYDEPSRRKSLEDGRSDSMEEGDSLLALACSSGYFELARVLLAMGANVDDRGSKGDLTPLMDAASQGHLEIVRLLINHGADVNAQSACGNSPLMYACAAGHEEVVKELLKSSANVEDNNENGHTPLMEAASAGHVGVAKILLDHGAGINTHSNEFKESALTVACYKGHLEMVKFLLEAGADQQHKTDEMHTALMEASMDGHVEVAKLLLDSGAQVNMPADSFESPLTLAACGGHVELAELLIERGAKIEEVNDEGYTPLMEAAREGHLAVVQCLLQNGAAINTQTEETHETALTLAACGGFLDVVDVLLKSGADIEFGASTPLMEAAQEGHLAVVKYLLDRGADIRRQTQTGDTGLSYACENGHLTVAELLVDVGADPEHLSEGGRTPLMKACRGGHLDVIKFLLQRGANVNRQSTNNDHTPLSLACAGGHVGCVEALLVAGANPFHKLRDNTTMLIEAARGGHAGVMKVLLDFVPATHLKGHSMSNLTSGKTQTGAATKAAPIGGQKLEANKTGNTQQTKNSVSVLRKSRSTSTLDPCTTSQLNKECLHNKSEAPFECQDLSKASRSLPTGTLSQKNANATPQPPHSGTQKQGTIHSVATTGAERKGVPSTGYCSECISKEASEIQQISEPQSTGQTSIKRSVRTEPIVNQVGTASVGTSTPTLNQTGPPLVPSQVTAATAISERPKAKPSKPSARKQIQLQQQQGTVSPVLSPGSEKGQSPSGSSSSSSGVSPTTLSSTSSTPTGAPKTVQQLPPNLVPSTVTPSAAVVQMQVQQVRSNISSTPFGNPPVKLDSKQLTHLFAQHQQQIINKSKGSFQGGIGSEQIVGSLGISNATTTTTTTTVVVTHGNGETETIIEGDNLPPGANEMIMNAAAAAFPMECFPVQPGLQMSPSSGVHLQSYQLSSPGTATSVAPITTTTMQTTTIINSATGMGGFQSPMVLSHPPPLPPAIVAAAAAAGVVPPSGAPPAVAGAVKGSTVISKLKDSQKSSVSQPSKSSGSSVAPVQQPQTPSVPPVATVAGIQTTKKQLAKRTRPFSNSSSGSQSRQQQNNAHTKQNQAVASTQTTLTGQIPTDKILKHLDLDCATESGGETSLTVASASGHYDVVEFLLSRKAHIEHRDKKGCTPLILAADGGHDKIVEVLIAHGADVESQSDRTKDTALSLACTKGRYEVVEQLLKKGANKEHRNVSDYTPLSLAASGGYVNIIKLLLQHGAEINSRTGSKLGISPLMLAAMNGNTQAVKLLLDMGSDINAQIETNKNTALTLACFQGRTEVVSLLLDRKANLEHRAKTGLTPLMEAANGGYTDVGKILLDRGADVNAPPVPATKDTALTIAADKGHFRFVELLLQRGAIVDARNKKGCTPLWLACHGGHSDVSQILFKHGADLDAQDNRKVSCLMGAFRKGHVKVIRWIVKNVQQFPSDGEMIRFYASIQNEPDLLKKCQQCAEFVKQAKDKQALEANKNASILLEELDLERSREESKRQAAARRREKKKKKKQEKKQLTGGNDGDEDENDFEDQEYQEPEDENANTVDSGIDANSLGSSSSTGNAQSKGIPKNNKENLQKSNEETKEQQAVEVLNQAKSNSISKSNKKKKSKKEKEKSPPSEENSSTEIPRKPTTKDVLKESENKNATENKITDKVPVNPRDKRSRKENVEFHEEDLAKNSSSKDNSKTSKNKSSKHHLEALASNSNSSPHHHPEPLMGISLNPSNLRKGTQPLENIIQDAHQPQYHVSSASSAKSGPVGGATGFQIVSGKGGRKDDGWKEVTRSCPSSKSKKVMVPSNVISRVIGRGGCNINAIRETTGAHIEVEKQQKGQLQPERTIQIKGTVESTKQAYGLIIALINEPDLDVKKLLPTINQAATFSSWSTQTYVANVSNSSQRGTSNLSSGTTSVGSLPIEITGSPGRKCAASKGSSSPVNFSTSPPGKKVSTSPSSTSKRSSCFPISPASSNFSATNNSVSCFSAKSVPTTQPPSNFTKEASATTPTKTVTPTFSNYATATPPPTVSSPLVVASSAVFTQDKSQNIYSSNQILATPNATQFMNRVKECPDLSENSVDKNLHPGNGQIIGEEFVAQIQPLTKSLESTRFESLSVRNEASEKTRIEKPSVGGLTLEYSPFNYQFSKNSNTGWYQEECSHPVSSFASQLPPSGLDDELQPPPCNLGPVGTVPNLGLSSLGGSSAIRSMNFASVAASGISSSLSITPAHMSQAGIQNGTGHFNPMGLPSLGTGKTSSDDLLESDVPKADASKAPGYRGNAVGSPVHRVQGFVTGIQQSNFTSENMSLPQFQGPNTGIATSQASQGVIGFPRQLNQSQAYPSNNGGVGVGIQQPDFVPRNLSPQSSNSLSFPNSGVPAVSSTSTRNVAKNLVISSRLNPRAPSFTLPHAKMSPIVQPPSQQFNSVQQQQHNSFKMNPMTAFGGRTIGGLNSSGRQGNAGGTVNIGNQGWNSYSEGSSIDLQGLGSVGSHQPQPLDQCLLSGVDTHFEPAGSKQDERRNQRPIGPIGAERSMKSSGSVPPPSNATRFNLPLDYVDSGHFGIQQQQNPTVHLQQQNTSSWGVFGTTSPQIFPGGAQHHPPIPPLTGVTPSHVPHLPRGNSDIRPFAGNRFLDQMDPNRFLDYHQMNQMYEGQRLLNGAGMPIMHMPSNVQPNMFPFGIEQSDQQPHVPKMNTSWGDSHLMEEKSNVNWGKWGN